jgi:hypothetical protein
MYNISVSRKAAIGALAAVSLLLAMLLAGAPKASANISDCQPNQVCVWSGVNGTGTIAWWWRSDTGCKSHVMIPTVNSTANFGSSGKVREGGTGWYVFPGAWENRAYTGDTCWPF